jgi:hypothetical protein
MHKRKLRREEAGRGIGAFGPRRANKKLLILY